MAAARRLRALGAQLATGSRDEASSSSSSSSSSPGPPRCAAVAGAAVVGGLVTATELESYVRDGFVQCSGLVSAPIVDAAVDSMWEQMAGPPKTEEADPWAKDTRPRPQRGDRSSWGGWAGVVDGPEIVAAFTPQLLAVAQVLADAYEAASPFASVQHPIGTPPQTLAINIFPVAASEEGSGTPAEWKWPGPHTDGAGERVEPRACRIQHMTYLTASGEHGGGTKTHLFCAILY
jgi:hypothetical protein|eukprot:COSAG06_NODE_1283_length_10013_cov_81.204156_3_plen_234_part_00